MAKEKSEVIDVPVVDSLFFLKQEVNGIFKGQWIIYSKTKWGDKTFNNYSTKEQALSAIKYFNLNVNF